MKKLAAALLAGGLVLAGANTAHATTTDPTQAYNLAITPALHQSYWATAGEVTSLTWLVTTRTGDPVQGVSVQVTDENNDGYLDGGALQVVATTGADGIAVAHLTTKSSDDGTTALEAQIVAPHTACYPCGPTFLTVHWTAGPSNGGDTGGDTGPAPAPVPTTTPDPSDTFGVALKLATTDLGKVTATATVTPATADETVGFYQTLSNGTHKLLAKATTDDAGVADVVISYTPGATVQLAVHAAGNIDGTFTAKTITVTKPYASCAALNRVYPHGVAKYSTSRDHATGAAAKGFKVSKSLYLINKARDVDHDNVTCEKR